MTSVNTARPKALSAIIGGLAATSLLTPIAYLAPTPRFSRAVERKARDTERRVA